MPFVNSIRTAALALALALFAAPSSFAIAFQSNGSGNWNDGNTWNQAGAVPGSGDTVQILDGHTVTVTTTSDAAGSISFGTLALGATLQINPGAKLTVTGNLDVDADALGSATADVGSGTLTVAGNINISEGLTGGVGTLRIGSGSASCSNVTFSQTLSASNTRIEFTGAGLLSLKGSLASNGTLVNSTAGAGSTIKFDGSTSQTIGDFTYQNLGIANSSANAVEATGSITVNGTLGIQSGIFLVKSAFSAGASSTLQMLGTSVLKLGDAATVIPVALPNFATYSLGSATTIYYGANANQNISFGVTYQNLQVAYTGSVGSPTKQMVANTTILGDLTIDQQAPGSVTLDVGAGIVTVGGSLLGDGGLTFLSGGELRLAGNFNNTGTFSAGTGMVTYNGAQFQNVRAVAYNDLYITGLNTNANLLSNGGSAVTLTIDANSYFDLNTSFTVSALLQVEGFLNGTGDTLTLGSSAALVIGSGEIYANVISGDRSIAGGADLLFGGNFTVSASSTVTNLGTVTILNSLNGTSATWINGANSSLAVGGNVMTSGTLNASASPNTVSYNGLGQTVLATTYHDLILTTPGFTPGLKTMPTGLITVNNDFTISGAANVTPANAISVDGDFTLTGTATFDAGGYAYPVLGNWTQSGGTFTAGTSIVQFNGGNQTITGTTAFNDLDFDGTGTKTLTGNLDLSGNLAIFSGVSVLGGSYTINVGKNWSDSGSTFVPGTSTVIMDGSTAASLMAGTFNTLQIAKSGAGSVTLASSAATVDFDLASGTFDLSSNNLDVADDFTLASGSTFNLSSGSVNVAGPISTSGSIIAGTGTFTVDGSSGDQTWGGSAPPLLHNLTVDNSSGDLNASLDLNVSGFLTLTNGTVVTGANAVKVTSGQVLRTSGYIDGRLDVTHSTTGAKVYPLGTTLGYSPVAVTIATAGQLDLSITSGAQPDNTGGGSNLLQTYWTIYPGTVTGPVDLAFEWPVAAVNGTEANYVLANFDGSSWIQPTATVTPSIHLANAAGVSSFTGDWTVGESASVTTSYDLEITTDGSAVAGVPESITITAKDGLGNTITSYSGDHTLTFAGATQSPSGDDPVAADKNAVDQTFGSNTVLTFTAGVANTNVTFYTNESVSLNASEPSASVTGTQAGITVAAAPATLLSVSDVNAGQPLYANGAFILAITATDSWGNPSDVVANTDVTLSTASCGGCTGTLGGTLTLQIPSGNTTANFSGLTYSVAEPNVLVNVDATSGDSLASNSTTLTFATQAAGVIVTNTNDSGAGSLRDAINQANSGACGTPCNITFDILPAGAYTFQLASRLPAISVPVVIDGNTQDGFTGTPILAIDGNVFTGSTGLELVGGDSTLRGFILQNLGGTAVKIASDNNVVQNCWIGTSLTGTTAAPNGTGISIDGNGNTLGGNVAASRNVISGNITGILLAGSASGNTILGNYIGTNATGTASVGNGKGISLMQDAASNTIGGTGATDGNVISGNSGSGIVLSGGSSVIVGSGRNVETTTLNKVLNNSILDNYIGVAADGATILSNAIGVELSDDAEDTVIDGNVISGNGTGLILGGSSVTTTTIQSNLIGVAADGTTAAGNINAAIAINGSSNNLIGGLGAGDGNDISHNGGAGISITGAGTGNVILSNSMHAYGTLPIDLDGDGADVQDAGDADTGGNNNQNYPLISTANVNGANVDVTFSVNSSATSAGSMRVEIFHADGTGAPLAPLGWTCFAGNNLVNKLITVGTTSAIGTVAPGDPIVATATSFTGSTCSSPGDGTSEVSPVTTTTCIAPAVTITGPTSTCPATPVTLDAGAGFLSYAWSTGDNTRTITITPTGTTTYTVTVTGANGCPGSDSHIVTLNTPTPVTITGPATACDSATLDAGAGFASYLWTTGATTRTISVTSSGTYGVTVTDANGCTATDGHTVTITNTPGNSITASGPTTFCNGGSVILTASSATAYLWSTGETTQSITVTTAGSYSVQTSNGSCTANSAPVTVTVNTPPTVTITGPTSACDSATLNAGAGFASYLWSTGDTTPTINVTATGSYSVTVTDANDCSGSDTHNITIATTPGNAITPGGPTTFCAGGSVVLTASTAASYNWSTGENTQSITVTSAGSYSVQTSNGSCVATSAPVNVTVNTPPVLTISGPAEACTSAILNSGGGFSSYNWSTGDTTPTITVTNSGTYSLTVTDANGCTATDTHAITINTTPGNSITPGGPTSFCTGGSVVLTASTAASYLWSTGETTQSITVTNAGSYSVQTSNGSCVANSAPVNVTVNTPPVVTIIGPASACDSAVLDAGAGFASYLWSTGDTTPTINVTSTGTYSVTVTDINGCSGSDTHNITITPTTPVTITGPTSACDSATLDAGAGFATYLWSTGATTRTINVTTGGTYSVTVTNAGGCSATDSHAITISNTLTPVITGPTAGCTPQSVTLDAGSGFTSYLWSTGETTQTIDVTATGTYSVTVTGAGGCSGSDSHGVTFSTAAPATIAASGPTTFCAGGSVTLTASAGASYLWSNGATTQSITVANSGSFSVGVTNATGCQSTSAATSVTVNPAPIATISAPSSANANATNLIASVPLQAGATYVWGDVNATITSGQGTHAVTFSVGSSGTAKLTVIVTLNGCESHTSKSITIDGGPTVDADLAISKSGPASVQAGAQLTYTLLVTNNGPSNAPDVTVTDALPLGTTLVSVVDGPWTCSEFSAGVFCNGSLAAGANHLITIRVNAPQQGGTITNTATVDAGVNDPVAGNNSSSAITNVLAAPANCATVPPSLLTPANGANVASPVAFSWNAVTGASEYEVWLVTDEGTFLAGTTNTTSLTKALPSGTSGWYVVARFTTDCTPLVSAQGTFTVTEGSGCTHAAPQLTSPSPGSTVGTNVTFAWTPVPGAIGYRVWIEANGTAAQDAGTTDRAITLTADVPAGALVVYVDTLFSGCPSGRSTPVAFTVAAADPCANRSAASPLAPANGSTINSSSIDFSWTAANDADGYRLWAGIDGGVPAVLGETADTSLTASISGGVVRWYVEALYNGCASVASQTSQFTIPRRNDCATQPATLLAPANGSAVSLGNITFSWSSVPNAIGYELWLTPEGGLPALVAATSSPNLAHAVTPGRYEWFVRTLLDRCPPVDSQAFRFTFTPPANCLDNDRPIAIAPLSNAKAASPLSFSWSTLPGATSYDVFVIRGNHTERVATSTSNHADGVVVANGRLRWFVRAYFANGCTPLDSGEEKLEVVAAPAACAQLEAPEIASVGQISSGIPFAIQWTEIAGATSYQLQLATDSKFTDAELISTTDTHHQLTRTNLGAVPQALYARVRAIDSRCKPEPNITPYGASSAIFILPIQGNQAAAPVSGGIVTYHLPLGPELAGQSFTASAKEPWISVAPSSGVVPEGGLTLVVTANTNGLPLGTSLSAIRVVLNTQASRGAGTNATTLVLPVVGVSKATPVLPQPKSAPPPDALIIPAVAHTDGLNSKFESDVRVTNTSSKLLQYQVTFTPSGGNGLAGGKQTTFSIEPGRTVALDDVLRTWFGTGTDNTVGTLEVRPLTQTASTTPGAALRGLPNLVTFAASRTFNVTPNGTFGQYIPAVPFANFIGGDSLSSLSLQQVAQSVRYRTNLGIVEASGQPVSLMVKVFGSTGQKLTEFPVQLAGGEHTQLNAFLASNGIQSLDDGRVEVSVIGGGGKVTAYASVLDNDTNDPLLVTPVTLNDVGDSKWVMPGVADIDNGTANWQTDMRVFNGGTEDVTAMFSFYSQNGGAPKTAEITIPAGQVRQFDRTLSSVFGVANDGGAVHISTPAATRLVATARTYNQTSGGTYGQFISAVTPGEAASRDTRALQILQVEESDRFRTNLGLAEVTGNPVTVQLSIVTPDTKSTAVTQLTLAPNEFRQFPAILRSFGLGDTFNARIIVRVIDGTGRVTAYGSMIDQRTNDPTYVPAQ
jgi:uncharacterized repeat protein (TIGR01451 family)